VVMDLPVRRAISLSVADIGAPRLLSQRQLCFGRSPTVPGQGQNVLGDDHTIHQNVLAVKGEFCSFGERAI
jgi:hypothetical protein